MAVYEFIINNVQKVTIDVHGRTVTVYYNACDVSHVGDFPVNDWSHAQEVVHAHSIRCVDCQGVISTITMDASLFMLNQCAMKPITTVYGRIQEETVRQQIGGQLCPTTIYRFSVRKVIFGNGDKEETNMDKTVKNTTAFTINRVVEIRKAKMWKPDDDKFLIFFERDEDEEPKIDIYSEDPDTISAIKKKLKKSSATKRYYLVANVYGKITEPNCKNRFFAVTGYIDTNKDIVMVSYEEVIYKEEKDMKKKDITVQDVYDSMTDTQQKVCQFMISEAIRNGIHSFTPESIKKVIYNDPATIIFWSDGTKTIVKCMEDEEYDPEKGFMAAVTKKVFGDKYGWVMRHQVKPIVERENKVDVLMESIAGVLHRKRTAQESAIGIRDQMVLSGATHWELETFDRFVRKYISKREEK